MPIGFALYFESLGPNARLHNYGYEVITDPAMMEQIVHDRVHNQSVHNCKRATSNLLIACVNISAAQSQLPCAQLAIIRA